VFLQDWTELEDDAFGELLLELPFEQRVFIVAEKPPCKAVEETQAGTSGVQPKGLSVERQPELETTSFILQLEFPRSAQDALAAGKTLMTRDRLELVRVVVNGLMRKSLRPSRDCARCVAEGLVKMFPASLEDRGIDGQKMGTGYDSLLRQLENRIENLSRGKRLSAPEAEESRPQRKSSKTSYGCLNWQLQLSGEGDVHDSNESKEWMKREAHKATKDLDLSRAMELSTATYGDQRAYINSVNPIHSARDVKEEWPLLFHKPLFYAHAKTLLGKDMLETFTEGLKLCTALLARHFVKSSNRELLFWSVQAEEAEKRGEVMAKEKVLLPQLACYFKEKTEILVQVLEEGNSITDQLPSLPCTPMVVAVGSIFSRSCLVAVEQQILFDEPVEFHEAACLLFCAYYVLNMVYPRDVEATLEFIQRQICGINPAKGSKRDSYRRGLVHPKILRLMKDVK
ncbi:uncharacterized protein ISCGN_004437, partial [Ixodes scapularis]